MAASLGLLCDYFMGYFVLLSYAQHLRFINVLLKNHISNIITSLNNIILIYRNELINIFYKLVLTYSKREIDSKYGKDTIFGFQDSKPDTFFNMYLCTVRESTRITQEMFFFALMLLPLPLTLEWSASRALGHKILSFISNIVSGTR